MRAQPSTSVRSRSARSQALLLRRGAHHFAAYAVVGVLLAAGTTLALWWMAGFGDVLGRLHDVQWPWLAAAFGAEVVAYLGYMLAYREVARVAGGPSFDRGHLAALVSAGFAVFIPRGGFSVDLDALRAAGLPPREARVRVLGLGTLEYAVLAPVVCGVSLSLILTSSGQPSLGLTLPWAIGVPAGLAAAIVAYRHRAWFRRGGRFRRAIAHPLDAFRIVLGLARAPARHGVAFAGMAIYWAGDIFCLWAALHAFTAGSPPVSALLLGYATGYALTRRSLPLAGAGVVEALLPTALVWVGIALAPALLAVGAYRMMNLWLPLLPATAALRTLRARLRRRRPARRAS